MARSAVFYQPTHQSQEVSDLLQLADKLVRAHNFSLALEQIAKARAKDPGNSLAEAYEQSVLRLLGVFDEKKQGRLSANAVHRGPTDFGNQLCGAKSNLDLQEDSVHVRRDESEPHGQARKEKILNFLTEADEFLARDQFAQALAQVAQAIVLMQDQTTKPAAHHDEHRATGSEQMSRETNIVRLLDEAKQLANRGEPERALERLLEGDALIPSDGSFADLEHHIAKRVVEYYRLLRTAGQADRQETTEQSEPVVLAKGSLPQETTPEVTDCAPPENPLDAGADEAAERQLQFGISTQRAVDGRLSQLRGHLLRSLRHIDDMRLVEAAVEAEIASLVEPTRNDVRAYAQAVTDLSKSAKARLPLNSLKESHEAVRQQAKDALVALWYEEMLSGISGVIDALPFNEAMLKRRREVEQAYEAFRGRTSEPAVPRVNAREAIRNTSTSTKRTKRQSLDQFGFSFDAECEPVDESRAMLSPEKGDPLQPMAIQGRGGAEGSEARYTGT